MAITLFGSSGNPVDNGTLYNTAPPAVTPPASMVAGDLVVLWGVSRNNIVDVTISNAGGQSWTAFTLRTAGGSTNFKMFWARFNGTWTANPSITSAAGTGQLTGIYMAVARPTSGSNTWAVDVADATGQVVPTTPFDVTATGQTAVATSTISFFTWVSNGLETWGLQTAGFTNIFGAQRRNNDTVNHNNYSLSVAYKINTSPGATGNVTNRQLTATGVNTRWTAVTFKEQASGVTLASINTGATPLLNGQTGIVLTGAKSGASWSSVKISPTDNINDGAAVNWPISSQTAPTITMNAIPLPSFNYFSNLYVFATDSGGASNSSGFVIRRGSQMTVPAPQLKALPPGLANQANLSNINYNVQASSILGTSLLNGTNATTDASGNLSSLGTYTLTSGGPVAPGDDVWLTLAFDTTPQSSTLGSCEKITPTYT